MNQGQLQNQLDLQILRMSLIARFDKELNEILKVNHHKLFKIQKDQFNTIIKQDEYQTKGFFYNAP